MTPPHPITVIMRNGMIVMAYEKEADADRYLEGVRDRDSYYKVQVNLIRSAGWNVH